MRLRLASFIAALAALLAIVPAAQAASLHIADAEVTVAQGGSSDFTISLTASGALTCRASATVAVDSVYSLNAAGQAASGMPADVTFDAAPGNGSGNNCTPTWDGAPDPYALTATATAASDTALGDYTAPVGYVVENAPGTGPAGKLSNAGTVNVTIHVVAAPPPEPVLEQPAVELPPQEQEVLDVPVPALRPVLGKSELIALVSGTVRYRTPGGSAVGLSDPVVVPNGTVVDATKGVLKITVERDRTGVLDTVDAWGGGFVMNQAAPKKGKAITSLILAGPLASPNRGASAARVSRARASKKGKRLLWVNGKGNFKTKGKRASAIVLGTFWVTEDTSAGTKVSVRRGAVSVRDLVKKRTVLVTTGHSYTAHPRQVVAHRVPAFTGRVR